MSRACRSELLLLLTLVFASPTLAEPEDETPDSPRISYLLGRIEEFRGKSYRTRPRVVTGTRAERKSFVQSRVKEEEEDPTTAELLLAA